MGCLYVFNKGGCDVNKLMCAIGVLAFVAGIGFYMQMIDAREDKAYVVAKCQCPPGECHCPSDSDSCQCPSGHCTCPDDK